MSSRKNNSIGEGKQHLILCEGMDEKMFLIWYLNYLKKDINSNFETIQVEDFGGNDDLHSNKEDKSVKNQLELWSKDPNFRNIKSLVVVRDAERDENAAVNSIKSAFKNAGLPVPSSSHEFKNGDSLKTGFLLFPKCSSEPVKGTLEDLCLSILKESEPPIDEIEMFISDLNTRKNREFPHLFKTKLHTYFSITDDFVSSKIGEAARDGAFDWNSSKLDPIKSFLEEMIKD